MNDVKKIKCKRLSTKNFQEFPKISQTGAAFIVLSDDMVHVGHMGSLRCHRKVSSSALKAVMRSHARGLPS